MVRAIVLFGILMLAACTSTSDAMKSWVGSTDAELMAKWGAPDLEAKGANGTRVLTYQGRNGQGRIVCRQNFTVNAEHKVTSWSHDCPL